MKRLLIKRFVRILLCSLLVLTMTGCQKISLDNTVKDETKQNASHDWMTEKNDNNSKEEEYFDVNSMEDEDVDYSKYEEKKAERDANESNNGNVTYSDGSGSGKDEYQTNPVPPGMQNPVNPGEIEVDEDTTQTCYLTISCATILNNMGELTSGKESLIPSDGIIYETRAVTFYPGETVFDVLLRETRNNRIHMEYSFNPLFNSNYIEAINNLYEFDCGKNSGWMYNVNGWYPNYGSSRYIVQEGDEIQWNYTCDLGRDLGTSWMDQND